MNTPLPRPTRRIRLYVDNANHKALENGEAVEALIDVAAQGADELAHWVASGGDLNMTAGDLSDVTALHALARSGSGSTSKSGLVDRRALVNLLDAGANPTLLNRRGETAFFRAVVLGLEWMVEEYVARQLDDWEVRNVSGKTALECGLRQQHLMHLLSKKALEQRLDRKLEKVDPASGQRSTLKHRL